MGRPAGTTWPACSTRVDRAGIGPGIEIVASQTLRTYPHVTDVFVRSWRDAFDRHGFVPSSFGANLDMGRRRERDMTPRRGVRVHRRAVPQRPALGFPLVRIQSAQPELIRRLMPVADELDLTLGWEIHAPIGPNSPKVMAIRELYDEIDSPRLGFVADFSSTMHAMAPTTLRKLAAMGGLDAADLDRLQQIWATDADINAQHGEFVEYLHSRGIAPEAWAPSPGSPSTCTARSSRGSGPTSSADRARAREVLRHRRVRQRARDRLPGRSGVRRGPLLRLLLQRVGGARLADLGEADPIDLVRKQHDLIRRSITAALAGR